MTERHAATGDEITAGISSHGRPADATTWRQLRIRLLLSATAIAVAGAAVPILVDHTGHARVAVEPDAHPFLDLLTSCALATTAAIALSIPALAGLARANGPTDRHSHRRAICFFVTTAAGAAVLATDELIGLHEALVEHYPESTTWPLFGRADNWVFVLYGVFALVFLLAFRSILAASMMALALLAGAVAAFAPDAADAIAASRFAVGGKTGDSLELAGSLLLLGGIIVAGLAELEGRLQRLPS